MCGRYAMAYSSDELPQQFAYYNIHINSPKKHYDKSYNVAPTNVSAVYRPNDDILKYMKWGLVPHWIKDVSNFKSFKTFNAREESLQSSRMWSQCCRYKRCVVPISGYYEWRTRGRSKDAFYVTRKNNRLMFLAGLYDYVEKDDLYTYTIITGKAPEILNWLHDRMPVLLEPGSRSWDKWLSDVKKWDQKDLDKVLATVFNENTMEWYQVNNDVGKISINEKYLTEPISKLDRDIKKERSPKEEEDIHDHSRGSNRKQIQIEEEKQASRKRKKNIVEMLLPSHKKRNF